MNSFRTSLSRRCCKPEARHVPEPEEEESIEEAEEDELVCMDEQERYFPLVGWRHCFGPMDPWAFQRPSGEKVHYPEARRVLEREEEQHWVVENTDLNDDEGWVYGTDFRRLHIPRRGGRAGKRATDVCRRRRHLSREGERPEVLNGNDEDDTMGLTVFWQTLHATLGRRSLGSMPMDPTALWRLRRRHGVLYREELLGQRPLKHMEQAFYAQHGSLILDLAHVAIHVRASYGYAMAQGHMDSVSRGGMMFTLRKCHFDVTEQVDDATNTQCLLEMTGLSQEDLKLVVWSSKTYRPSHYVAVDSTRKWIVVSIRGTLSMRDLLTDLNATQVEFCGGYAHYGFVRCAAFVEASIAPTLASLAETHPDHTLVLCGHSMGGAVAAILGHAARSGGSPWGTWQPKVFTLGCAPCLSKKLAYASSAFLVGAIHAKDPAPRLSITSVERFLDEMLEEGLGNKIATAIFPKKIKKQGIVETLGPSTSEEPPSPPTEEEEEEEAATAPAPVEEEGELLPPPPEDPASSSEMSNALALSLAETHSYLRVELFTPGRILHVDREHRIADEPRRGLRRKESAAMVYERQPDEYQRLLLSTTLMGYHLPKGYLELLLELVRAHDDEPPDNTETPERTALRSRLVTTSLPSPLRPNSTTATSTATIPTTTTPPDDGAETTPAADDAGTPTATAHGDHDQSPS